MILIFSPRTAITAFTSDTFIIPMLSKITAVYSIHHAHLIHILFDMSVVTASRLHYFAAQPSNFSKCDMHATFPRRTFSLHVRRRSDVIVAESLAFRIVKSVYDAWRYLRKGLIGRHLMHCEQQRRFPLFRILSATSAAV